jgi:hypothetical protein
VTLAMYRYRKRVWKIGYSESEVRRGQVFVAIVGSGLLISGLVVAAQYVF